MANWFKIYETDLDETRLKYALGKLPEVGWVWVGILSECCKHRSDTIRWGANEIELFGFSDRLKVSIPKVNEAINLLVSIEYIRLSHGWLKVLKWNEKQSEYCIRKERGDYGKKKRSRIISDTIEKAPLEERRGEDKRVDEIKKENPESAGASGVEHEAFIKGWSEYFLEAHNVKYQFDGGRDGKAVKELLRMGILRLELLELAKKAWKLQNGFLSVRALTIHGFRDNFNAIQTGVKNGTHLNHGKQNPRNLNSNAGHHDDYANVGKVT